MILPVSSLDSCSFPSWCNLSFLMMLKPSVSSDDCCFRLSPNRFVDRCNSSSLDASSSLTSFDFFDRLLGALGGLLGSEAAKTSTSQADMPSASSELGRLLRSDAQWSWRFCETRSTVALSVTPLGSTPTPGIFSKLFGVESSAAAAVGLGLPAPVFVDVRWLCRWWKLRFATGTLQIAQYRNLTPAFRHAR